MLESETSPHKKPIRCIRANNTTMASTNRFTVSCRTPRLNKDRYGSETAGDAA